MICHNVSLKEMARLKPASIQDLLAMHGIGKGFVENYGEMFLISNESAAKTQEDSLCPSHAPSPNPIPFRSG